MPDTSNPAGLAPTSGHRLLSYKEAAAYLGPSFTERWIRRQVSDYRTIPAIRLNGRAVIARADLDAFVERARIEQLPP